MIENFLRPPRGFVELLADGIRLVGLVSVIAATIWWQPTDAGILALALPALLLPRFLGVRAGLDVVYGVVVLAATWSNVIDLYTRVPWWDVPMHVAGTGALTLVGYLGLARLGAVPPPRRRGAAPTGADDGRALGRVLVATAIGLALSALWEMVEWLGWRFVSDEIFVAYQDTIGDMAVGGVGAAATGWMLATMPVLRSDAR
ncbi:hypothetical protein N3K63_09480 [Microbacterium sp. W1N]|uniref:hypothetical protein n=1 Tax=Microbacterium festucae TaxID=2977531 RepID=UPI0021BE37BD|nr:hypothetical protein [Microbacterium festucae]MCT9820511.1 hypothetical protein [Microbacterium festucae]